MGITEAQLFEAGFPYSRRGGALPNFRRTSWHQTHNALQYECWPGQWLIRNYNARDGMHTIYEVTKNLATLTHRIFGSLK